MLPGSAISGFNFPAWAAADPAALQVCIGGPPSRRTAALPVAALTCLSLSSLLLLPCLYLASTLPQLVSTSSLPRLYLVSTLQAAVKAVGELVAAKKVAAGKVASFAQGDVANAMAAAETGAQVALKW